MNLENECYNLSAQIDSLYDENLKLKEQIKKMKYCENCKHQIEDDYVQDVACNDWIKCNGDGGYCLWELKED